MGFLFAPVRLVAPGNCGSPLALAMPRRFRPIPDGDLPGKWTREDGSRDRHLLQAEVMEHGMRRQLPFMRDLQPRRIEALEQPGIEFAREHRFRCQQLL